ncbi:MAG: hypothetical protein D6731_12270 [Planctomycetota bacterium]|nr:MAG: hypothetical protein D6731_12270 [Planctomycetota bacterium]
MPAALVQAARNSPGVESGKFPVAQFLPPMLVLVVEVHQAEKAAFLLSARMCSMTRSAVCWAIIAGRERLVC